ncbi:hypothetical protein MP228_000243 [Amoeboaphelidium protococcarum]|nr:hypothetical protein MP228_000243 [Amoeboaphelidium protococcarum]
MLGGLSRSGIVGAASLQRTSSLTVMNQQRGMATLKELQMRLKAIKNIGKITKSMKMIASTKLSRAQRSMEVARVYGECSTSAFKHMELKEPENAKTLVIAATSDRGLCGAIHSTVSKPVKALLKKNPEQQVFVIGDKPRMQIVRESKTAIVMSANGIGKNIPTFAEAAALVDVLLSNENVKFDFAKIYYNTFKSAISYECIPKPVYSPDTIMNAEKLSQFEIEDDVLKNYAEFSMANALFQALAEGHASEMAARRTAMENATKNAGEIIDKLTMTYNRSRQAAITNDLVDIITGASAL